MIIKNILRELTPPIFLRLHRKFRSHYGFFGNYKSWQKARKLSIGYDSELILNKVKSSLLKVKTGEAMHERDSCIFDKIEYSWPLLAALLWIAIQENGELDIIDFGGSLGTTYFQNRLFLNRIKKVDWNIVEQKHFLNCGKKHFENKDLHFYGSIADCLKEKKITAIIFSSVIQYLEDPYGFLDGVMQKEFKYIVFDRTSFLNNKANDRLTIQKVSSAIYRASYPCWFFSQDKFSNFFKDKYQLVADFESADKANIPAIFKGYIFKIKQYD